MGRSTLVQFTNPENFPLPIGPRYVQPNETVWVPWEQIPPEFRSANPPADGPSDAPVEYVQSFTDAALVPTAAKYGRRTALVAGVPWKSGGVSANPFPDGWVSNPIPQYTRDTTRTDVPQLPDATKYGERPAWIDGRLFYSNGSSWARIDEHIPKRPVVGQIGDSLTNLGHNFGPWVWQVGSIVMQAAKYSNYAFIAGPGRGYPGNTTAQILAAMDTAEPMTDPNTTHILVLAGTNDPAQAAPTTIGYLRQIYDKILAAGKTPIACTIPPRTTSDPTNVFNITQLNNAIPKLAQAYGIPCADIFEPLNTWSATSGAMVLNTTYAKIGDLIHFNQLAVQSVIAPIVAKAILPILGSSAGQAYPPLRSRLQCANSSGAPMANTLFRTISGTINLAGSLPSSPWTASLSPTHIVQDSATAPVEVGTYGQSNCWTVTLNPTNDATVIDPSSNGGAITNINPEAGDLIGCCMNFKYVPGVGETTDSGGFEIGLRDTSNKTTTRLMSYGEIMTSANEVVIPDSGYIYMERLLPSTFTSGSLTWYITLNQAAAATGASLSLSNSWVINWTKHGVL